MENEKFSLVNVSQEELVSFNNKLQDILTEDSLEIRLIPNFVPTTEGKFVIDVSMVVYKKVAKKEEGIPSPFIENGGEEPKTEETPQTV